jgi:hypothetical protein
MVLGAGWLLRRQLTGCLPHYRCGPSFDVSYALYFSGKRHAKHQNARNATPTAAV